MAVAILAWLFTAPLTLQAAEERGGATATATETIVATVNGTPIRRRDIDDALPTTLSAAQRRDTALRQQTLQALIAQELFWQRAKAQGLDREPSVRRAADKALRNAAAQRYIEQTLKPAQPSETEVHQRYERIVGSLGEVEYRVSLIETADESDLRFALAALRDGTPFAAVARRHSVHPSAGNGGELNWLSFPLPVSAATTKGLTLAQAQALSRLDVGAVSSPIESNGRWAVLRLDAKRPTLVPEYAATRDMLARALYLQNIERASQGLTADLLRDANIKFEGKP